MNRMIYNVKENPYMKKQNQVTFEAHRQTGAVKNSNKIDIKSASPGMSAIRLILVEWYRVSNPCTENTNV